jgi:hypothetical protein
MFTKRPFLLAISIAVLAFSAFAQTQTSGVKRTTTKTDRFDFGSGGTIVINGAPNGSITVLGQSKNEIEITAEMEFQASSDADAAKLAEVTGFITDESAIKVSVMSIGNHNKFGLKKLPKDFPKHLLTLPFTINYKISVPRYSDLEIDGGKGDLKISGVEGSMKINFLESKGNVEVISGNAMVTIGSGSLDVLFAARGSRGRFTDIQVAKGDLSVSLPTNLSAEIDATVLRTGSIENTLTDLKPRDRKVAFSERSIIAKAGVGGVPMKFTVGDGKMKLAKLTQSL